MALAAQAASRSPIVGGGARPGPPGGSARYRPHLAAAICLVLLWDLVPAWLGKPVLLIALVALGVRLLTFRRWADEHKHVPRFLWCFLAMLLELTWENCMVWLVSASDLRKYQHVPGLQDNVEIAGVWLARRSKVMHWALHGRLCHTLHFLMMLLVLAFSPAWDQMPYSGFGLMARVVLTITASRVMRVASFMCTVLPNPSPGCYQRRFPPVPDTWWATIKAGYTTIRGFGGCNDLIFSGHAAFWVLAPLALQTYYARHRWVSWLVWLMLVQASIKDVLDKQHYSVDMLLAVVVTWACWDWLAWVYPQDTGLLPARSARTKADKPHPAVLLLIVFALVAAGVIVIGGKA